MRWRWREPDCAASWGNSWEVAAGSVLAGRRGRGGSGGAVRFLVARAADQELADQVFELQGRLGQNQLVTVLQRIRRAAGLDRNVLRADQTAGEYRGRR